MFLFLLPPVENCGRPSACLQSQLKYYYQLRQLFLSSSYSNILMLKLMGESTSAAWGTRGQVGTAPFPQMALWMLMHSCFSYNPFKNLMMIHIRKSNHDILLVDNGKRLDRNLGRPYNLDIHTAHRSSSYWGKTWVSTRLFFLTACFPWPDFNAELLSNKSSIWVALGAQSFVHAGWCLLRPTDTVHEFRIYSSATFIFSKMGQSGAEGMRYLGRI